MIEETPQVSPPQSQEGMIAPSPVVIMPPGEGPTYGNEAIDKLNAFLGMNNIADELSDKILENIGSTVVREFDIDKESRSEWETIHEDAMELAKQVTTGRTYAGEAVADVKYPTLATSAIQFSARAYPNIIKGKDVVKCKIIGVKPSLNGIQVDPQDPEAQMKMEVQQIATQSVMEREARAKRIEEFMSFQFLEEIDEWEDSLDQLLISLPIMGCMFKKTYYDSSSRIVKSPLVNPKDLVVNYYAKSLEEATRVTHVFELTPNEIVERVNAGVFLDIEYGDPETTEEHGQDDKDAPHVFLEQHRWWDIEYGDPETTEEHGQDDKDAPHIFLEQHRWWDIDKDGYQEPYVVTVHKSTEKVVRITARFDADGIVSNDTGDLIKIEPVNYFTRFIFMPAFDGNFYGMGFGSLLSPINATINATINQLLDAGTLSNRQSGFLGKGIRIGRGDVSFKPGEWKSVTITGDDIRKGIVPLPVREPSGVLFNLLGMMIESSKELSSVADVLTGESQGANSSPTTVLSLIEQALKVFSVIYKRVHRSLKSEFQKVWRLNRLYLTNEKYATVVEDRDATVNDFYSEDIDVVPISDEIELTNIQRIAKAESLLQLMGTGLNDREIKKRYLEALNVRDIDKLLPSETAEEPIPPEIQMEMAKLEVEKSKAMIEQKRVEIEQQLAMAKIEKSKADTMRTMIRAEGDKKQMAMSPNEQAEFVRLEIEKSKVANESRKLDIEEKLAEETARKARAESIYAIARAEAQEPGSQMEVYKKQIEDLYKIVQGQSDILKMMAPEANVQ